MVYKIKIIFLVVVLGWIVFMVYPIKYEIVNPALQQVDDSGVKVVPKSVGAFVINLDRSPERLAYVMPQVKALGFPVKRVVGIDGKKLSESEIENVTNNSTLAKEKGTIGCTLSHMKAWREFLESNYEYAVIFEDDVAFDPEKLRITINE